VAPGSGVDPDAPFQVDDPGLIQDDAPPMDQQCLNETREALPIGLDIYVMLDSSLSMLDLLPADGTLGGQEDKWDAVRKSIEAFVEAPETKDIGVGLQYFPQVLSGVPFTCTDNSDCGSSGGACSNSRCVHSGTGKLPSGSNVSIVTSAGEAPCADDSEC